MMMSPREEAAHRLREIEEIEDDLERLLSWIDELCLASRTLTCAVPRRVSYAAEYLEGILKGQHSIMAPTVRKIYYK